MCGHFDASHSDPAPAADFSRNARREPEGGRGVELSMRSHCVGECRPNATGHPHVALARSCIATVQRDTRLIRCHPEVADGMRWTNRADRLAGSIEPRQLSQARVAACPVCDTAGVRDCEGPTAGTRGVGYPIDDSHGASSQGSSDGRRLLFAKQDWLVAVTLDRSRPEQVLVREEGRDLIAAGWLADGSVVYESSPGQDRYEIKVLDAGAASGRVIVPLGEATGPAVSPDGRWLAYTVGPSAITSSPANNVVVEGFPGRGHRTQVSAGGGRNPAWSADGRTLYYLDVRREDRPGSGVFARTSTPTLRALRSAHRGSCFAVPTGRAASTAAATTFQRTGDSCSSIGPAPSASR